MKTEITVPQIKEILLDKLPAFEQRVIHLHGVPRGGVPVAIIAAHIYESRGHGVTLVDSPLDADVVVDDIIDSGRTRDRIKQEVLPREPAFIAPVDKTDPQNQWSGWIEFPWEKTCDKKDLFDHILRIRQRYGRLGGALRVLFGGHVA